MSSFVDAELWGRGQRPIIRYGPRDGYCQMQLLGGPREGEGEDVLAGIYDDDAKNEAFHDDNDHDGLGNPLQEALRAGHDAADEQEHG